MYKGYENIWTNLIILQNKINGNKGDSIFFTKNICPDDPKYNIRAWNEQVSLITIYLDLIQTKGEYQSKGPIG